MESSRKVLLNRIQNILIVLLSVSAVFLFFRTQLSTSSSRNGTDGFSPAPGAAGVSDSSRVAAPVRLAVTGAYGRYASSVLRTSDEDFAAPGSLLGEALRPSGSFSACLPELFYAALNPSSIYYELEGSLPLSALAGLLNTEAEDTPLPVRRLLLSRGEDGQVWLYLWQESGSCLRRATGVSSAALDTLIESYTLGGSFFALDLGEDFSALDPLTLFSSDESAPPVLHAESTLSDEDALLTALDFNPRTEFRYTESSGTVVIVAGNRILRLSPDCTVVYSGGTESTLQIPCRQPDHPTAQEAAQGVYRLLSSLLPEGSEASLCLTALRQNGSATSLEFNYLINNCPVRFSDGQSAASVELIGNSINAFTLRLRQYTSREESALLLPRTQAAAIAAAQGGGQLLVCYADDRSGRVSAVWLAQ